jgi:hypothetical protein
MAERAELAGQRRQRPAATPAAGDQDEGGHSLVASILSQLTR